MRKLIVVAAGLMSVLTALPLYAADVTFSGEFRVRAFWSDNVTDGDSGVEDEARFNDQRFRLKTAIKAGVTTGVVVLDFGNCTVGADVATFNAGAAAGGTFTGDCRFGTGGLGGSFNVVGVREAHLRIDLSTVDAVLGRQTIKLGHGIVLDDTVDAITVMLPLGAATITGSLLQIADATDALGIPGSINNDTSVWLVNVGMDHDNHVVNFYNALLYDQSPGTGVGNFIYPTGVTAAVPLGTSTLWENFLGVSLDVDSGPINLAAEASYAIGRYSPAAGDARLGGWNLMGDATFDAGGATVGATVLAASGQDPSATGGETNATDISGNFVLGTILLNNGQASDHDGGSLGGGFGGAGILAAKLHASLMPTPKLTVGGAAIYARTAERVCQACERTIGLELDANAAYAVDDNLTVSAAAGYLFTGDGATDFYTIVTGPASGASDSDIWRLVGKVAFTF